MWYDTELDSLFIKSYNSQLTANKKEEAYKKEHETFEELEAEERKSRQEIIFCPRFGTTSLSIFTGFPMRNYLQALQGEQLRRMSTLRF